MSALLTLVYIVSIVCWIMVLIKLFKAKGALHGILGIICGLYTFIWGWINHKSLAITKVMIAWTACFILGMPLGFMAGMQSAGEMQKMIEAEMQKQQQQQSAPQQ